MAQVKLAEIGERLWRIMGLAMAKLPADVQKALKVQIGSASMSWALALVLAGWGLLKKGDEETRSVLMEAAVLPLVNQIDGVTAVLPPAFKQFLEAADQADNEPAYAGAAVYLADAFNGLLDLERSAVLRWINGPQFREAGRALTTRYPQPASLETSSGNTWTAPATRAVHSRADRFDRADRPRPRSQSSGNGSVGNSAPAPLNITTEEKSTPPEKADSETPAATNLSDRDHCMAFLLSKGISQSDAELICQGPGGRTHPISIDDALSQARVLNVPLLVFFSATWCGPCHLFKEQVLERPSVSDQLKHFYYIDYDVDASLEGTAAAARLHIGSYPTFVLIAPDGHELGRLVGYREENQFLDWLKHFDGSIPHKPAILSGGTPSQVTFWQRELRRTDISPELRQYYELLLVGNHQYAYASQEDARTIWQAVLRGPLSPELRGYYATNLEHLDSGATEA